MKTKKLFVWALLLGIMASAIEMEYCQFTSGDFNTYNTPTQNWTSAQMVTLKVQAGTTVYLTNYVPNFDWKDGQSHIHDLGDVDYAAGYDMSANKYGYVFAQKDADGNVTPLGNIHYGDGTTKEITYTYEAEDGSKYSQTTAAYLLDTFNQNAEIFFVMTPNGYNPDDYDPSVYNETINSYAPVNDPNNIPATNSILVSRQINTIDQVGNIRVNFGTLYGGTGHEFVVGYEAAPPVSGQPLPGVLLSGLLSLGTATVASRLRKCSRK